MDRDVVKHGYDRIAAIYHARQELNSSVPYLERLGELLAPDSLILDLGCGAGLPVDSWLVENGHRVIGLDFSEGMLRLAKQHVPSAEFRLVNMQCLKPKQFSVDAVVSFFALIHVDRQAQIDLLKSIRTFLPVGGYFLATVGRDEWEGVEEFLGVEMQWGHFDESAYANMLRNSGFKIVFEGEHQGNLIDEAHPHPIFLARAI